MTAGRGPCQVDSMREPDMTIPPIEYLTAANARRLRDPRVMGLDAFIHPYTDDAGAASVAQALARLPEHWKATPVCVAFSRLFAVDQTSIVERGDVVEGRRVEARLDPAEVTGIEDAREQGRGIVDVPSVPQRVVVAVGYDDSTGDDVAADWRRS